MPGVRPRAWWRPLAVALVAVAAGVACRQTIGLDAYSTATTDAGPSTDGIADATTSDSSADASACGLPYGGASCAACVQTSCCAESETCAKDAVCIQSQQCLGTCGGDPACRAACPSPTGESAAALAACMASSCAQACGLPCGAMAPAVSPALMALGCQSCFEKGPAACNAATTCGTSSDCQAYVQCLRSCYTPDCREACAAAHDAGSALYAPVESTLAGTCATACGYGQDWRCIGQVQWSAPAPGVTTTDLIFERVNGFPQRQPVPGALVSLCGAVGASCASPLASGRTDDAGYLDLPVPTVASSIVPAGIDPLVEVTAPGYLPTYLSYFFPLTQRTLTFAPGVSPVLWPDAGAPPALAMDGGPVVTCMDGGPCCPGGFCPVGPGAATPPSEVVAAVFDCQGHPAANVWAAAVVEAPFSTAPISAGPALSGILLLYASDMGQLNLVVWEVPAQPPGEGGVGPPPGSVVMTDGGGPPVFDDGGCSGGCFLPIGDDGGLVCAPGVCVGPAAEAGPPEAGPLPPPFGGPPPPSVPEGGVAIGHFYFSVVPGSTTMVWIVPQPGL